jgi:hypothetical protein
MVRISLVPALTPLYLYVSTFRSMCAVPNMAVFCSSLTSWFLLLLFFLLLLLFLIIIIIPLSHIPTNHNILLFQPATRQSTIYITALSLHFLRACFCYVLNHSRVQKPQPRPRSVEVCSTLFSSFADSFVVLDLYPLQERAPQHDTIS